MPANPVAWSPEFQANTMDAGPSGNSQFDPVVIQLTNGNFVIFWSDGSDASPAGAPGADIVGQIYDATGTKIGAEFRANPDPNVNVGYFDAVALPNGEFAIGFTGNDNTTLFDRYDLVRWTTNADGTIGPSTTVVSQVSNAQANFSYSNAALAAQGDGSYVFTYQSHDVVNSTFSQAARGVDAAGVVTAQYFVTGALTEPSTSSDIAALPGGDYVVVSEAVGSDPNILIWIGNADGTVGTMGTVATTATNGRLEQDPSVAALTGGGFVVAWQSRIGTGLTEVQMQVYDASGLPIGAVIEVEAGVTNNTDQNPHLIALTDGGFVVVYEDNTDSAI